MYTDWYDSIAYVRINIMYTIVNKHCKVIEIFDDLWQAELQLCYYLNHGHDYYLEYLKENMNIRLKIFELMESDNSFTNFDDKVMRNLYKNASEKEKALFDNFFIALFGYPLHTIINEVEKNEKTI